MERTLAEQRLPQRDAERELVRARGARTAVPLLGCHVRWRADHRALARQAYLGRGPGLADRHGLERGARGGALSGACEPEVEDADPSVGADHHVVWFEVAVADAGPVRRGQAPRRGGEDLEQFADRSLALAYPRADGLALDELHGDEHLAPDGPDVEHGHHVRVGHPRQRPGLAQQPGIIHRQRARA